MRLLWNGRTWEPGTDGWQHAATAGHTCTIREQSAGTGSATATKPARGNRIDRLVQGDALDVLAALKREGLAGKVQLAYVDPPYLSQTDYKHEARLDGRADGRVKRSAAYGDKWRGDDDGVGQYLEMLAPRLEGLARLLAPRGTLWVQLDWRAAYLARVILDEIFGRGGFKNEIVWRRAPNLGRQAASAQFGRTLDTILVYGGPEARLAPPTRLEPVEESAVRWDDAGRPFTTAPRGDYTDASIVKLDAEGRVHRAASGKVYIKYFVVRDAEGRLCRERRVDALWTDVPPLRHAQSSERTGYPTQKPLALLERIIGCGTQPGDLVVDVFGGSGTTAEAAHRLGRRFVVADESPLAIATARARLLRAGATFRVEGCGKEERKGPPPAAIAQRIDPATLRVELREPAEPLAWAIDLAPAPDKPFLIGWHGERKPGSRAVAAPSIVEIATTSDEVAVRVFEDDGTVREATVTARAPKGKSRRRESSPPTLRSRA